MSTKNLTVIFFSGKLCLFGQFLCLFGLFGTCGTIECVFSQVFNAVNVDVSKFKDYTSRSDDQKFRSFLVGKLT